MPPRFSLLAVASLASCSPVVSADPFERTGELIAFSGGAAGAGAACATCHGIRGQGDGHRAPRLAGLDAGYSARQLENYASGARRHPQMEWIARQLGWGARQKVAAFYAGLNVPDRASQAEARIDCEAAELYHRGDPARAVPSCASCHGGRGAGSPGNPPLAGQPAPYLARQLDAWASGERYGDPGGAMTRISRLLSHRRRQAVAGYAAALPGDDAGPPLPAACLRTRRPDRPGGA